MRASLPCVLGLTLWCTQPVTAADTADSPTNNRDSQSRRIGMSVRRQHLISIYSQKAASQLDWNELEWAAMLSSAAYAGCTGKTHDVVIMHQIADRATATQVRLEAPTT